MICVVNLSDNVTFARGQSLALFGTDGIRGRYGDAPFQATDLRRIGFAIGESVHKHNQMSRARTSTRVLIGRDTRQSCPEILEFLSDGLCEAGLECLDLGVIPTPGVAYCVRNLGACCGIVISASHNPAEDNGIKIFGPDGFKLSDRQEEAIERHYSGMRRVDPNSGSIVDVSPHSEAYFEHLVQRGRAVGRTTPLGDRKLIVDCAHGAATGFAARVFRELGAEVIETASSPNGLNINDGCGALHPDALSERVIAESADAGVCFDGDADRLILLDEKGTVLNGDTLLAILALRLKDAGKLPNNTLVATVMSNLGLEICLREHGIKMLRTPVGDRHVVAEMLKTNSVLGGEQSGHIIHLDRASTTGDGIFNAAGILAFILGGGAKLSDFTELLPTIPQRLVNVEVRDKPPFETIAGLNEAIAAAEAAMGDEGRVVLRYSGTEGIARVMIEGRSEELLNQHCDILAGIFRDQIGAA